jgi:exoribonuclease II
MNVFYEEDGGFKVASAMQETDASLQVESVSGKRSKIKSANVLLRFESALASFMDAANAEAEALDTDFLWEASGLLTAAEFNFADLAQDYFGGKPSAMQQAAMAIKLHTAPMYFYRKGKGVYKAAPPETLKAAMAGVEKKRLQTEQVAGWVTQLQAGELPAGFADKARQLLYAPDKNSLEWKAIDQAAQTTGKLALEVMHNAGLVQNAHDYHLGAFLFEMFKHGTEFGQLDFGRLETVKYAENLPISDVKAFSIDDATTTEIDDAFSLAQLENGNTRIGIHIAAPALGVLPNSSLDDIVRNRLSTVYMPGNKITMLPEAAIRPFSLDAGETKPSLSLYCELNATFEIVNTETKVELITIADNLRHDSLEPFFNENTLAENSGHAYWPQLKTLFDWAESLEKVRGKANPNAPKQIDYNFYVTDGIVKIVPRERGSPMDKLVAELMIFANSHWGGMLKEAGMVGIYRAQTGGKVFMTTHAEPHQGLGVAQYAWSTSPLRRAVDLINQRQIIACAQQTTPTYAPKDEALKVIMRDFDQTYSAYSDFQTRMERFWCLQYLIQENISEINATVWRDNLVRLENMFYITKVPSLPELKAGTQVRLSIVHIEPLLMELNAKFIAVIASEAVETPDENIEQVIEI